MPSTRQNLKQKMVNLQKKETAIYQDSNYYSQLETFIEVFDIYSYDTVDYENDTPEDWRDYGEAAMKTGAVFGILVSLRRK